MNQFKFKRILAIMLVLVFVLVGCKGRTPATETDDSSSSDLPSSPPPFSSSISTVDLAKGEPISDITPDFLDQIAEKYEKNSDTVGWLSVPGTSVNDVVLQRAGHPSEANFYYLRLNFEKQYDFYGVYYADARAEIGATREELGVNTCIYGHAITDKKDNENYTIKFGPLHDFRDPDFAREHPYIFLSTAEENMAFEVVAVFVSNSSNPDNPYNSNPTAEEMQKLVNEQILPRSKYIYEGFEPSVDDKYITLSTCIYTLDNGTATGYPNTEYRYAILARLVDADEPMKDEAVFEENADVIVDPDGAWKN